MSSLLLGNYLVNTAFILLLCSLFIHWINLYLPKAKFLSKVGYIFLSSTNICLFIHLGFRWIIYQYFPLSNLYESLLFLAWCLTMSYLIIKQKYNQIIIGSIVSPISLFIIAFASFSLPQELQSAAPLVPALRSNWLMMHVTIMMTSYAALLIGSLLAIIFLIIKQFYRISKQKITINDSQNIIKTYSYNSYIVNKYDFISSINILESLDNLSYRTIGLGFPLLTVGIIAGAVWANEAWGSYWSWDPKETWALITWLIFAAYLHTRLNKSWEGEKPAILATFGFLIVWICYLGVNFLGQGLHNYGWLS